ncbi:hypothetical protein GGR56DRAFT_649792 [Xylariaceae sp. FL0804]|nr:hypothetical protein GGR56DRAFT_649792 [Xylariaceae sp. FL0804]
MEPASKRLRIGHASYDSDDDEANRDELSMTATQFNLSQDSMYQLDKKRAKAEARLKSGFESIFEKYGKDFTDVGDEIDLRSGEVVTDNGHLRSLQDERDGQREASVSSEEEDRILGGTGPRSKQLTAANSSVRPQPQPSHSPWSHTAAHHSSPYRLSSLAFSPGFTGAYNPFGVGASPFGHVPADPAWQIPGLPLDAFRNVPFRHAPADPAWQVPDLPTNILQNGFGLMGQPFRPGSAPDYGQGALANFGGGRYGTPFKKLVNAKHFSKKPVVPAEEADADTEEDDILLDRNQQDPPPKMTPEIGVKPTPAVPFSRVVAKKARKGAQKALSNVASSDDKGSSRQSGRPEAAISKGEDRADQANQRGSQSPKRGQRGQLKGAHVQKDSESLDETERSTRIKATDRTQDSKTALDCPSEPPERTDSPKRLERANHDANNRGSIPKTVGESAQCVTSPQTGRKPRKAPRGPGRPKKSTTEESPSPHNKADQESATRPQPLPVTNEPSPQTTPKKLRSIIVAIPYMPRPSSSSALREVGESTPQVVPTDEGSADSHASEDTQHRKSIRSRKPMEFYGDIAWQKRGVRPPDATSPAGFPDTISDQIDTEEIHGSARAEDKPSVEMAHPVQVAKDTEGHSCNALKPPHESAHTPEKWSPPELPVSEAINVGETEKIGTEPSTPTAETPRASLRFSANNHNSESIVSPSQDIVVEERVGDNLQTVEAPSVTKAQDAFGFKNANIENGDGQSERKKTDESSSRLGSPLGTEDVVIDAESAKPTHGTEASCLGLRSDTGGPELLDSRQDAASEPEGSRMQEDRDNAAETSDASINLGADGLDPEQQLLPLHESSHERETTSERHERDTIPDSRPTSPSPSPIQPATQPTDLPPLPPPPPSSSRREKTGPKPARRSELALRPAASTTDQGGARGADSSTISSAAAPLTAVAVALPETPTKESRRRRTGPRRTVSLASLVPGNDDGNDDDADDRLDLPSSPRFLTPTRSSAFFPGGSTKLSSSSRRGRRLLPTPFPSSFSSPPQPPPTPTSPSTSRRHQQRQQHQHPGLLLVGRRAAAANSSPTTTPATEPPRRHYFRSSASASASASSSKRKFANAGVQSSPLARTVSVAVVGGGVGADAGNSSPTPTARPRCGVDGFVCDRDFCFTCCK